MDLQTFCVALAAPAGQFNMQGNPGLLNAGPGAGTNIFNGFSQTGGFANGQQNRNLLGLGNNRAPFTQFGQGNSNGLLRGATNLIAQPLTLAQHLLVDSQRGLQQVGNALSRTVQQIFGNPPNSTFRNNRLTGNANQFSNTPFGMNSSIQTY